MAKLRILHVVTYMGLGGLETMIMNYYRKIDKEKIQFDFLVHRSEKAYYDEEIENLGGKIYHLPRLNPFSSSYKNVLKEFFISHPEYKIVHIHQDCLSGIIAKIAKNCGVPVRIAHSHNSNQDKNFKYPIKLFFKRNIPKYATHLFACGKKAGEWMFSGADFEILNNAIEVSKYTFSPAKRSEVRKTFGIDDKKFVVGHVGRFSPQKNHTFLLDIFLEISKKCDALLLLVGDGELRSEIEKKVELLGISNKVMFLGKRNDVYDIMQAMDCFVFPSKYEGFPVSVVEAQASGLPCIISDTVPLDCKITDLIEQISLQNSVVDWSNKVFAVKMNKRSDTSKIIKYSGFDIETNVKKLTELYLNFRKGIF